MSDLGGFDPQRMADDFDEDGGDRFGEDEQAPFRATG
jgi:hypothetical protein